jgi:glycosyltransferase involved in cell wall biosynthesis
MTFYQGLIPALQAEGVAVRVIEGSACHAAAEKSQHMCDGASVETLELDRLKRWHARFGQFAAVPGLRRHLAAAWAMWEQAGFGEDADVVEACDWGLLFVPPAIEAKRPLLVQCHGSVGQIAQRDPIAGEETQDLLTRLLESTVLAGVDTLQTYSCADAASWQNETGRNPSVVRPAWSRPALPPAQGIGNRGLVVGRAQRWKGPQVVCEALSSMGGRAPQIDWVGRDTPWGFRDTSTAAYLSRTYPGIWGKEVTRHDPISPEEVRRRQSSALFNLVPSTWDVFNFTAVEAMASGRPTIVSTGAGASELIEDGVNGFVFPSGDAEKLAEAIDRVLSASAARLADIGRAAQDTVRRALDPASITAQRLAVYRSTIDAFRGRRGRSAYGPIEEICRPADGAPDDGGAFLDQVPLRTLVRHVAGRLGKKALSARALAGVR